MSNVLNPDDSAQMPVAAGLTILVVDDSVENLDLANAMLERAGYQVMSALSGEFALRAVEARLPDLALLDVRMPGMDGYAVCRELKARERTRDIPVIFISAGHDLPDRVAAFSAGGVDYVTKPFCEEEVLARVRTHVRLHQHARYLEKMVAIRTAELMRSETHLLQLSNYLQRIREEDRAHFARELHDELGQNLTALRLVFDALSGTLAPAQPVVATRLKSIDQLIENTVDATRRICEDMRPAVLDDSGLGAALSSFAEKFSSTHGVACDLLLDREGYNLEEPLSTAIYRIVQESLTNIARHAQASHAMVALKDQGSVIMLTIADDGRGLTNWEENAGSRKHFGLLGIRERVQILRGHISIDSAPGRGTRIEVQIPKSNIRERHP